MPGMFEYRTWKRRSVTGDVRFRRLRGRVSALGDVRIRVEVRERIVRVDTLSAGRKCSPTRIVRAHPETGAPFLRRSKLFWS